MSLSVECPACGIQRELDDESIGRDLVEGHEEKHGHEVEIDG